MCVCLLTPARDGLLNHVAGMDVQRAVIQASLCQFGFQILGYSFAGLADTLGAEIILVVQSVVLLLGVWAYTQLREVTPGQTQKPCRKMCSRACWMVLAL